MKKFFYLLIIISSQIITAQVGVNTSTPDDGSALQIDSTTGSFVPPRMDTAAMNLIPTPLEGSIVFNTDTKSLHIYTNSNWENQAVPTIPQITLYKSFNGTEDIGTDSNFHQFPIGEGSGEILSSDPTHFDVISDGKIRILKSGTYQISGGISLRNVNSGDHKYILGVFIDSSRKGYLCRGYANIPGSNDYWGASGVFQFKITAGQVLDLRFYLTNSETVEPLDFCDIGILRVSD
ncbi:hypothetical protein LY01_02401 [Nonlabens xylanidelens]|uniref:Uncharacterized protein n=1 Tax=Nonlabens xylanidelens TaxID=191564 RepID=A0A2S6IHD6_9FLAO|nr:hypothetical protein [Nonlabens xylanidelens]PPK93618.1 hypothetical protein LY01_02401 [Nonlabens xylanidelens]PQJ17797.1 hypothetical protein BST94_12260 [Nonlabens xylanidelens]